MPLVYIMYTQLTALSLALRELKLLVGQDNNNTLQRFIGVSSFKLVHFEMEYIKIYICFLKNIKWQMSEIKLLDNSNYMQAIL